MYPNCYGFIFLTYSIHYTSYSLHHAVDEVLTSVQKTEESLRRLKNLRERSTAPTTATPNDRNIMSDDDKIRVQLYIDVIFWTDGIEKHNISREDIERLPNLIKLLEDATKSNRIIEDK